MTKKITTLLAMLMLIIFMAACGPAVTPTTATTSETASGMDRATTTPAVFSGTVNELIALVNGFVASGEITGQAENGLLAKLETIQQKVLNGQIDPAANEMGAFINEVQAQSGKKISEAAATALIAKAQEVAAEFMAGIPVTGGEGNVVSSTPKPTPMGTQLKHQGQWDVIALQVVQSAGFSTFSYDLYKLPALTAWVDTLAYYKTEAAAAGWGDAPSQTNETAGGHYVVWSVTGADGVTNYLIIAQVDTPDGTYTLNIIASM